MAQTLADATWCRAFFTWRPQTTTDIGALDYEVHTNGTYTRGSLAVAGNFPDDVPLGVVLAFQTGAVAADVFICDWVYVHAVRAAYTSGTG